MSGWKISKLNLQRETSFLYSQIKFELPLACEIYLIYFCCQFWLSLLNIIMKSYALKVFLNQGAMTRFLKQFDKKTLARAVVIRWHICKRTGCYHWRTTNDPYLGHRSLCLVGLERMWKFNAESISLWYPWSYQANDPVYMRLPSIVLCLNNTCDLWSSPPPQPEERWTVKVSR